MMLPAPSTTPMPCVSEGVSCARPAVCFAVSASTPGSSQTCALKPLSRSLSKTPRGSTSTVVRPPGAEPNSAPSSGLFPSSSARSVCAMVAVPPAKAYGPDIHSSPTNGDESSSPLMATAAATHSAACRTVRSRTRSISSRRLRNDSEAQVFSPPCKSSSAESIPVRVSASEASATCRWLSVRSVTSAHSSRSVRRRRCL